MERRRKKRRRKEKREERTSQGSRNRRWPYQREVSIERPKKFMEISKKHLSDSVDESCRTCYVHSQQM